MRLSLLLALTLCLFACQQETTPGDQKKTATAEFEVNTTANAELKYEKLQLFPITASASFIANNRAAEGLVNLKEVIDNKRFRITEKKPYGRMEDSGAINALTVQNKSEQTVFLMAGDVVQGGRQDRVIAADMAIPPRTITDIPVFCVEKNRWTYMDGAVAIDDHTAQQNKKVFAFSGYYNVASSEVRKSVIQSRNQEEVWKKVSQITASNKATSNTGAYANLEQSEDFTALRNQYLRFFQDKFDESEQVVGVIAVTGKRILGADIFANPILFKKQYKALIHSYITDAITDGATISASEERVQYFVEELNMDYQNATKDSKYFFDGAMVHYSKL